MIFNLKSLILINFVKKNRLAAGPLPGNHLKRWACLRRPAARGLKGAENFRNFSKFSKIEKPRLFLIYRWKAPPNRSVSLCSHLFCSVFLRVITPGNFFFIWFVYFAVSVCPTPLNFFAICCYLFCSVWVRVPYATHPHWFIVIYFAVCVPACAPLPLMGLLSSLFQCVRYLGFFSFIIFCYLFCSVYVKWYVCVLR